MSKNHELKEDILKIVGPLEFWDISAATFILISEAKGKTFPFPHEGIIQLLAEKQQELFAENLPVKETTDGVLSKEDLDLICNLQLNSYVHFKLACEPIDNYIRLLRKDYYHPTQSFVKAEKDALEYALSLPVVGNEVTLRRLFTALIIKYEQACETSNKPKELEAAVDENFDLLKRLVYEVKTTLKGKSLVKEHIKYLEYIQDIK